MWIQLELWMVGVVYTVVMLFLHYLVYRVHGWIKVTWSYVYTVECCLSSYHSLQLGVQGSWLDKGYMVICLHCAVLVIVLSEFSPLSSTGGAGFMVG